MWLLYQEKGLLQQMLSVPRCFCIQLMFQAFLDMTSSHHKASHNKHGQTTLCSCGVFTVGTSELILRQLDQLRFCSTSTDI